MKHIGAKLVLTENYPPREIYIQIIYEGIPLPHRFFVKATDRVSEIVRNIREILSDEPGDLMMAIRGENEFELFGPRIRLNDEIGRYSTYFPDVTSVFVHGTRLPDINAFLREEFLPNPENVFERRENPDFVFSVTYLEHTMLIRKFLADDIQNAETEEERNRACSMIRILLEPHISLDLSEICSYLVFTSFAVFGKTQINLSDPLTLVEMHQVNELFGDERASLVKLFQTFGVRFVSENIMSRRNVELQMFEDVMSEMTYEDFRTTRPPNNVSRSALMESFMMMDKKLRRPELGSDDEYDGDDPAQDFLPITAITWLDVWMTPNGDSDYANFLLGFCRDRAYYDIRDAMSYLRSSGIWLWKIAGRLFLYLFTEVVGLKWSECLADLPTVVYERYISDIPMNVVEDNASELRRRFRDGNSDEPSGLPVFEEYLMEDHDDNDHEENMLFLEAMRIPNFMRMISEADLFAFGGLSTMQGYYRAYEFRDYFKRTGELHENVLIHAEGDPMKLNYFIEFSQLF